MENTWKRKNGTDKSRIEYWLIRLLYNISRLVKKCDIRPGQVKYTDHLALCLNQVY